MNYQGVLITDAQALQAALLELKEMEGDTTIKIYIFDTSGSMTPHTKVLEFAATMAIEPSNI
jgi:hypothetical protein